MRVLIFTIENFRKLAAACLLILTAAVGVSFAQYKGAPVKKERLVRALRSGQLQTADIVTIINRNGVDFPLTEETKRQLVAAGARPEVIKAVADNSRVAAADANAIAKSPINKKTVKNKFAPPDYDELLASAMYSFKEQKNPAAALRSLNAAVKSQPANPAAYQMLGFVYLYGLNDLAQAEKSMRDAFANGGSAVFRVYHDDNGKFTHRCTGSLYVSKDTLRFESDDNVHTFETQTVNIERIKLDTETTREWKKRSIYKVILKFGKEDVKFRFAPVNGALAESQMVGRFIAASNSNANFIGSLILSR